MQGKVNKIIVVAMILPLLLSMSVNTVRARPPPRMVYVGWVHTDRIDKLGRATVNDWALTDYPWALSNINTFQPYFSMIHQEVDLDAGIIDPVQLYEYDLLIVSGHYDYALWPDQNEKLKSFVKCGGVLWIDNCGDDGLDIQNLFLPIDISDTKAGSPAPYLYVPSPLLSWRYDLTLSLTDVNNLGDNGPLPRQYLVTYDPGYKGIIAYVLGEVCTIVSKAGAYGKGMVIVTTQDILCGTEFSQTEDLEFATNLIDWSTTVSPSPRLNAGICVAGSEDTYVYAYDFKGSLLRQWGMTYPVVSVAMDNKGEYIAAGSRDPATNDGYLALFHRSGVGGWYKTLPVSTSFPGSNGKESKTVDVKYNAKNNCRVVAAAAGSYVYLFDENGNEIFQYTVREDHFFHIVRLSQDGSYLVCADLYSLYDGSVGTVYYFWDGGDGWDSTDGTPIWTYTPYPQIANWVAISGEGRYVSVAYGGHVCLLESPPWTPTLTILWDRQLYVYLYGQPVYIRVDMPCRGGGDVAVAIDDLQDPVAGAGVYYIDVTNTIHTPLSSVTGWNFYTVSCSMFGNGFMAVGSNFRSFPGVGNVEIWDTPNFLAPHGLAFNTPQHSVDITGLGHYGVAGDEGGTIHFFNGEGTEIWSNNAGGPVTSVAIQKMFPCEWPVLSVSILPPLQAAKLVGQSLKFNSTVAGGTAPYTYQWYLNNNPVFGATSNTWTFTPATAGTYVVYLNVTDNLGSIVKSGEASVTVAPQLIASMTPLSASILAGQSVNFASTVSGGYTPYSYQWCLNGNPVSGATSNTWTFTPTTIGIYYVRLKVTDAKANTAQSDTARITVATVPVGGYSIPIQVQTKAEPVLPYIALITTLTAIFTKLRPKTKRKR
jgi:hypothetical protein